MITRETIAARLAENPRTECADCGCEEGCIDYLRELLREEREARQKHMIGLWYEAGTLHSALRSAWVRHGRFGSPQEARLFRLQWRAYQRQERRGDAYDKAF